MFRRNVPHNAGFALKKHRQHAIVWSDEILLVTTDQQDDFTSLPDAFDRLDGILEREGA